MVEVESNGMNPEEAEVINDVLYVRRFLVRSAVPGTYQGLATLATQQAGTKGSDRGGGRALGC